MSAASYHLPACPMCSSMAMQHRPHWHGARHTARKLGKDAFIWSGVCEHSSAMSDNRVITEPDEIRAVEDAWAHWVEQALAAKTERMPPHAAESFRRAIAGGVNLEELEHFRATLSPGSTGSTRTPEKGEQHASRERETEADRHHVGPQPPEVDPDRV